MNADELKKLQTPIKEKYREQPEAATITLKAQGNIGEGISCKVDTGKAIVEAGLHPATGGTGMLVCSGRYVARSIGCLRWCHTQRGGYCNWHCYFRRDS